MGGKSSKQKVKISKAEGGKQAQGKTKEQKESVENGETATDKSAQNEVTANEDGDTNKTVSTKSENAVTDLVEKRADGESTSKNQKELTQPEPVVETTHHPLEYVSADNQPAIKQGSPQPDENKTEIPKEEPVKETKSEELDKEEGIEKLEEPASQKVEHCSQEPAETITISEAEPSIANTEQMQNKSGKTGEHEDNIPATLLDTSTIGAITNAAAEAEETDGLIEQSAKCEEDGLELNVQLVQQVS